MCISVDLPDPDGPMTAVNCPVGIVSETPLSASTAVSPTPYVRVMSNASTAAFGSLWCSVISTSFPVRLLVFAR